MDSIPGRDPYDTETIGKLVQIRTKLETDIKAGKVFQEPPEYTQLLVELELSEKQGKQDKTTQPREHP